MNQETKVLGFLGVVFLTLFAFAFFFVSKDSVSTTLSEVDATTLIRDESHQTHPEARVSLVEFGDFQCPACASVHPGVKALQAEYGDRVNFVFRHFPLAQHSNAIPAANAVEAAGEQGKFWEMYDKIYENQNDWSGDSNPLEKFSAYAKDLGLDVDKLTSAVKDEKFKDKINQDRADGNSVGVDSTPSFYVNGQKVTDFNSLKTVIDQKLSESSN